MANVKKNRFIKLGTNKAPLEKWSKDEFRYNWEDIINFDNYAFIPDVGYCVLDADDQISVVRIRTILENLGIDTPNWATTKGHHWLFKIDDYKPPVLPTSRIGGKFNIMGLGKLDYKGWNKGYVRISDRVEPDKIMLALENDKVAELPLMMYPNKSNFDMTIFPDGERHDIMFRMWIPKLRKHWSDNKEMLKKLIYQIVKGYHKDPATDEKIWEWIHRNVDSSFDKGPIDLELKKHYDKYIIMSKLGVGNQVVRYDQLFDSLIERLKLVKDVDSNQIWGWKDGILQVITDIGELVRGELFLNSTNLKPSIVSELVVAITSRIPGYKSEFKDYEVVFKNGIYNARTGEFNNVPPVFAQNIIQQEYIELDNDKFKVEYKQEINFITDLYKSWATCAITKDVDPLIPVEIHETIACCMTRMMEFEKAIIVCGNAENGKSVLFKMMLRALGKNNMSAESLEDLNDNQFSPAQLYGKLANINADIAASTIKSAAMFKNLVSGDYVSTSFKGKDAFAFESYATIVFGANNPPYVNEGGESDAVDRRMKLIHFRNKFKKSRDFYKIKEYLHKPRTLSVVIRLALDQFKIMLDTTGVLTESTSAKALMEQYMLETDSVSEFFNSINVSDGISESAIYQQYVGWSETNKYTILSKNMFTKKAMKFYRRRNITLIPEMTTINGVNTKIFKFYR